MSSFGIQGTVVHNGVERPGSYPQRDTHLLKFGIDRPVRFLVIGRISEWKGQSFVLDALQFLSTRVEILFLGGTAPGNEAYLASLNFKSSTLFGHDIKFNNFVEDPSESYLWSDFVLVPSILPEPFGRVAIEALSYGRIPVVANHGGLAEIIQDEKAGLIFSPKSIPSLVATMTRCINMTIDEYAMRSTLCRDLFEDRFTIEAYQTSMNAILCTGDRSMA
jgi:glycosyltransferase involved in cell wall biosynthesis